MDPISIAFGLAQFAPGIIKWITGSDKSASVAEKVIDVAKVVTGKSEPDAALDSIRSDPALAAKFKQHIADIDADLEKAYLGDIQDARKRDSEFIRAGKRNYRADIMFLLAVLVICGLVYIVWKDATINEYVKGIFTLVLGRFLGYLDNIYNFEFGSTRGSQNKDATISQLSAK